VSGDAPRPAGVAGELPADLEPWLALPERPFLIGLTGPIGCGKSTVARMLARLGGFVIDADAVARAATDPGQPTLPAIRSRFGDGVVAPDGTLDRAALARIVFSDAAALADLEAIVHPRVRARIRELLDSDPATTAPFVVLEAIKLVEGGLARACDEVWLVTCDPSTQRERLAGRGATPEDVERRIAAQGDVIGRLAPSATRVVVTDGTLEEAQGRVEEALAEALAGVMAPPLPFGDVERPR
jgi:dephospho-CoA kinase